jgi:hypothetical protein
MTNFKNLRFGIACAARILAVFVYFPGCATMGGGAEDTPREKIQRACVKQFGEGSKSSHCIKVVKDSSAVQPCIQSFGDGKDGMWCLENASKGIKVLKCIESHGNGEKGKSCITKE